VVGLACVGFAQMQHEAPRGASCVRVLVLRVGWEDFPEYFRAIRTGNMARDQDRDDPRGDIAVLILRNNVFKLKPGQVLLL
jgi:hypothetical protein